MFQNRSARKDRAVFFLQTPSVNTTDSALSISFNMADAAIQNMKALLIYAIATGLSLMTSHTLSAADPVPAKKNTPPVEAKTKTKGQADSKPSATKPTTPATHTLKKGLFEIKVELAGIFDAVKASPISLAPEMWNSMSVVKAVSHGSEVKKGDVLVELETKKLAKAIRKAELAQPLSNLGLKLAELELIELEKWTPVNLANQKRSKEQAKEDLAYFEKTDRAHREKAASQNLKQSSQYLSYAREELEQLQKMYAADDLTEETEEIIVTRAKNSVEGAQFRMDSMKLSTARTLNTTLPREHLSLRDRTKSAEIAWEKLSESLPQSLNKKRLEVEKMKRDQTESSENLADMKKDLTACTIRAPHDGVVYYGANTRGKWATASMVGKKLIPGGKLMPHEVFMSVVQTQALRVQTSIPENKLALVKKGLPAKITANATPDTSMKGELVSMSRIPLTTGGFPGTLGITTDTKGLYPGMSCKVLFEIYKNKKALTVPKKAVTTEKGESFVHLKNGKKQAVKTGRSDEKLVEILSGLKEGDTIKL